MITISIPVKGYVKKYLIKKYGHAPVLTKKNFIGMLVLELISNKIDSPDKKIPQSECYTLTIPEYYFNKKGFHLSENHTKFLGACLHRLFIEEFYAFVDLELGKKTMNAYQAILFFFMLYDISEDDLKIESIYRSYQRYSKENIKAKKGHLLHRLAV